MALGLGSVAGCSHDWDKYDPRLGESSSAAGASAAAPGAAADGSDGGSAGQGGAGGLTPGGQSPVAGAIAVGGAAGGWGDAGSIDLGGSAGQGTGGATGGIDGNAGEGGSSVGVGGVAGVTGRTGGSGGRIAGRGGTGPTGGSGGGVAGQGGTGTPGGSGGGVAGQGGTGTTGGAAGAAGSGGLDPCAANLLQNPSFESTSGDFPLQWEVNREVYGSGGLWWAESTITHSGSGALALDTLSAVQSGVQDYRLAIGSQNGVPVTPGEQLLASVWARLDETGTAMLTAGSIAFFYDSLGAWLMPQTVQLHTFSQSNTFQEYPAVAFTVPAEAVEVRLGFRAPIDSVLYIDDACLERAN
jgi:hypothetical protein